MAYFGLQIQGIIHTGRNLREMVTYHPTVRIENKFSWLAYYLLLYVVRELRA